MIALKTVDVRKEFRRVSDLVNSGEKVLISRPHNENLVILSEREFNELERSRQNIAYLSKLERSMQEAAEGRVVFKTMDELEEMAK
jgi:antitoxin YefM